MQACSWRTAKDCLLEENIIANEIRLIISLEDDKMDFLFFITPVLAIAILVYLFLTNREINIMEKYVNGLKKHSNRKQHDYLHNRGW